MSLWSRLVDMILIMCVLTFMVSRTHQDVGLKKISAPSVELFLRNGHIRIPPGRNGSVICLLRST